MRHCLRGCSATPQQWHYSHFTTNDMYYTVDIIGGHWKAVLKVATDMIARHTIMIKKHPDRTHLFSWLALSGVPQSFKSTIIK